MSTKSISNPPGGALIWIVIYLELLTYGLAFVFLAISGSTDREAFHNDSLLLNKNIAVINTILLLTGGYLAARAVHYFQAKNTEKSAQFMLYAIITGIGFLGLKAFEYYSKIDSGVGMNFSDFFIFYWFLTGFHYVHVLVGVVILFFLRRAIVKKKLEASQEDIEAGVAFWHMCDIIWLFLFPILYLLF